MNKGKILGLIATYKAYPSRGCGMSWIRDCPAAVLGRQMEIGVPERISPALLVAELGLSWEQASGLFWMRGSNWSEFGKLGIEQQRTYVVTALERLLETGRVEFPLFEIIPRSVS